MALSKEERRSSPLRNSLHFPRFQDLPEENDINEDYYHLNKYGIYEPKCHWCFLGEISNNDTSQCAFLRNTTKVRDIDGKIIPVAFYHSEGTMEFNEFSIGSTLCLRYASSHHFLDMQVGIREESLSFCMVIPASIATLIEISDFNPDKRLTCWTCGCGESSSLMKCGRCRVALYCGKECQVSDWTLRHKKWCKALPKYKKLTNINYRKWTGEYVPF